MDAPHFAGASRVIVGLSGGVDSSVAALRLREHGYQVEGLFMFNWEEDEQGYCTAADDFQDARNVSERLGIPLHRVDFAEDYRQRVFRHFLDEYRAGRTPNPDVLCNREIKFGVCYDYARRLGADCVATGHYARTGTENGRTVLLTAADSNKDQTYFLHASEEDALGNTLFPLGDLQKPEVRRLAKRHGLVTYAKQDSTGICFIGERHFREFLSRYLPAQPGEIRDTDGKWLGSHAGLMYFTLGQRQGLGIGGRPGASSAPWYVVDKQPEDNVLVVGQGHDHPWLMRRSCTAVNLHWIGPAPSPAPFRCRVRTRHRQPPRPATVTELADSRMSVRFDEPQRALTPGQYAVVYQQDRCLGGGVIDTLGKPAAQ